MKILVVDDERRILELVSYVLLEFIGNVVVVTATSRDSGVECLLHNLDIDAAVVDIRIPPDKLAGLDLVRLIKRIKNIPVVILSAYTDRRTRVSAKAAGADAFRTKPADYAELTVLLVELINQYLRQEQMQLSQTHSNALKTTLLRRLQVLEERQAMQGISTPPEVILEIEDVRQELEKLEQG